LLYVHLLLGLRLYLLWLLLRFTRLLRCFGGTVTKRQEQ
jgi:hypothetical protein